MLKDFFVYVFSQNIYLAPTESPSTKGRSSRKGLKSRANTGRKGACSRGKWVEKSADQILETLGPRVSGKSYVTAWNKFEEFRRSLENASDPLPPPGEDDYLKYLDYLAGPSRGLIASSLWTTFSKLNNVNQVNHIFYM